MATPRSHALAIAFAALVAAVVVTAFVRATRRTPAPPSVLEATTAVRIVEHDRAGLVVRQTSVRDPARVRALLEAANVAHLAPSACRDDYTGSDLDLVLSGADIYARRTLHVYGLGTTNEVVLSSTSGCAKGTLADASVFAADGGGSE